MFLQKTGWLSTATGTEHNADKYTTSANNENNKASTSKWSTLREHVQRGHFLVNDLNQSPAYSFGNSTDNDCYENNVTNNSNNNLQRPPLAKQMFERDNRSINNNKNNNNCNYSWSPGREQRTIETLNEIHQQTQFSTLHCLLLILCYMALSVLIFSHIFRKWSIIDSVYFAVVTFSTIGYGDFYPQTDIERTFTCVYVLIGVSFVAIALGLVGSNLIDVHEQSMAQARRMQQYKAMSLFGEDSMTATTSSSNIGSSSNSSVTSSFAYSLETIRQQLQDPWYKNKGFWLNVIVAIMIVLLAYGIGKDQGWDVKTTIYYTIITATTVGYGDLAPNSQWSRFLGILFIPLAAVSLGRCIQYVVKTIINRRHFCSIDLYYSKKELTLKDLQIMDRNGDGSVTWSDFLEFMLLAMQKVDVELLEELRRQFDRLDTDHSGVLDQNDLVELAKKQLQSPKRKLELALYKKSLLAKCSRSGLDNNKNKSSHSDAENK